METGSKHCKGPFNFKILYWQFRAHLQGTLAGKVRNDGFGITYYTFFRKQFEFWNQINLDSSGDLTHSTLGRLLNLLILNL